MIARSKRLTSMRSVLRCLALRSQQARAIDDMVLDAMVQQLPMQPEPVVAGFKA